MIPRHRSKNLLLFLVLCLVLWFAFDGGAAELSRLNKERLVLWLKADAGVVTNAGGFVQLWKDQSGKRNDARQTDPEAMPALKLHGIGGQPAVRFEGVGDFLEVPHSDTLKTESGLSIFLAARVDDVVHYTNGFIAKTIENLPASFDFYLQPGGQPRLFTGNGSEYGYVWGDIPVRTEKPYVISTIVSGSNGFSFLNGVFNGTSEIKASMEDRGGPLHIGTRGDRLHWLKGEIAELLLFRGTVTEAERRCIHEYLGQKYGIEVVLDVIVQSPATERREGETAVFSATAVSVEPNVRFQWQRNGVNIPGATNTSYSTLPLGISDNGAVFRVRVSAAGMERYSENISLKVLPDTEPITVTTAAFLLRDQTSNSSRNRSILPPYSSRYWQTSDDAARSVVQAVAQTSDGFLWVATEGGLARFDGHNFEFIAIGLEGKTNARINALHASPEGELWLATGEDGVLKMVANGWTKYPLPAGMDPAVLSLQHSGGKLWAGTRVGLGLVGESGVSLVSEWSQFNLTNLQATRTVRALANDGGNGLVMGLAENVLHLREGGAATLFDVSPYPLFFVRAVLRTKDGATWIGANSGLLQVKDGVTRHYSKTNGLPDNIVTALYEDQRGNLWVGTAGGLCRFADERFVVEMTAEGEVYNQIFCFFEDRERNLWVGAKNGLYQLSVQQFATYTTRHGLAHNNVISVYEDQKGAMWIGTWGGGLHCVRDGRITIYSSAKNKVMRNDLILGLHGTADGSIWFGEDYDGGLYRLKDGELNRFGWELGRYPGHLRALLETASGELLVGTTSQSVSVLRDDRLLPYASGSFATNAIRCLLQARDGTLWVGSENGLAKFDDGNLRVFTTTDGLSDNLVLSLHEDAGATLWVGTAKGISRLDRGAEQAISYRSILFEDAVVEILEDDEQNLWAATRRGVFRVSRRDLDSAQNGTPVPARLFGKADGMISSVCVGVAKPSACKSRDGRLWFATTKGLAVTDPKLKIQTNDQKPPVLISQVVVDKKPVDQSPGESKQNPLVVKPGRGELEFHYLALSYTAPEKNRYRYKLEGADRDWVEADSRRVAFYNNLSPGDYTFRVIASNNDGLWNETGAAVTLRLLPHFWQTQWFVGGLGLIGFGLVGGAARFVTRRNLQRRLERLERQHAIERERTRIASDLHDQLGASLTRVYVLNELAVRNADDPNAVALHTGKSSETLRLISKTLHEIVWAVNPQNDTLRRLAAFIAHYTEEFFENTSVRCRLEIPAELPDLPLSAETRHNVFLIVKEALNNIAKHANATEVRIVFSSSGDRVEIAVSDNGKGFVPVEADSNRHGLSNMRRRMAEVGGSCEWKSAVGGQGTTVVIRLVRAKRI